MVTETPKERRKHTAAIFENIGVAAVQSYVLNPATTSEFPGNSESEPTRDEAREWLVRKALQKKRQRVMTYVGGIAAVVAAIASVIGLFRLFD